MERKSIVDICVMCYWGRVDDGMLETAIKTFRKVNKTALLYVYTDGGAIPLNSDCDVNWFPVAKKQVEGRRALCKIELLDKLMRLAFEDDRIIASDIDVYFLKDPFKAFDEFFDLGVTTRCHSFQCPINAGMFFMLNNENMRDFMTYRLAEISPHVTGVSGDWGVDQAFLNKVWSQKAEMTERFGIIIKDVGP
ncbi:unnamed protein product, partial [marine sediment metagenome]